MERENCRTREADVYLLLCQRYIELNPVRAGMVDDPVHYRWSSYRANGMGQADALLTAHPVYAALGRDDATRLPAYRALFRPELENEAIGDIRMALDQGKPLGDSRFIDSIERAAGQLREPKPRGRPRKVTREPAGEDFQLPLEI